MKSTSLATLVVFTLAVVQPVAAQQFTFNPSFPSGVDWMNATPQQMYDATERAVEQSPENTLEIVAAAIDAAKSTGRFPSIASSDGKQFVGDPENIDPEGSIEDVAQGIGNAAKNANPAMASQIDAAVLSAVPTVAMLSSLPGSGGGGGGGSGGGSVPLPSGFSGGGGGGSVAPDSN